MRERLLLACAALAAFGGAWFSGFHFDDYAIFADRALTSAEGWRDVWRMGQTRPLTYLTFWLNYQTGGRDAAGYHAVNLLLHVAAVLLLHDCLRRMMPERAALLAAAIFAVHPLQAEAVVYVWGRSIVLAAVFCLLSLRAWLADRRAMAVVWFAAALLSKEECAAFPLVLLLLDRRRWKTAAAMLGLAGAAAARVVYAAAVTPGAPIAQAAGIGPGAYLVTQGGVILRYLRLAVAPWGFTVDPDARVPELWIGLAAWAAVAALAWLAARRAPWAAAALVLLIPSSSVFPVADLAADRRMYLPLAALAGAAAIRLERWRWAPAICVALAALSVGRCQVWMTEERLWREAVERGPEKLRPKLQLARAVAPEEGLRVLAEARRMAPEDAAVAAATGSVLLGAGRPAEALAEFGRALALAPRDARGFNNRGAALEALGQVEAARADYRRAVELDGGLEAAWENLRRVSRGAQ